MSILLTSSALIVSLYQTFLIGLHRYLVITGSGLSRVLFKSKRKFIWYTNGWAISIIPLSFYYPLLISTDCSFKEVTADNMYVIFCIIAIPEFVYMVLILVIYCLAMCCLKRRYLNSSISKVSNSILQNKRKKYLKSMKSVSILLVAMLIFSGSLLVRNVVDIVQPLPKELLYYISKH